MNSPIEIASSLVIGNVESVSSSKIVTLLDIEAPQTTTLNAGIPRAFPKINSYILIPNEGGAVVGLIEWVGIENSMYPKRTGLKDFGLIDLPYPSRKMHLMAIGMLKQEFVDSPPYRKYKLERGVSAFPTVGDKVMLPTKEQLESIIEGDNDQKRFMIGEAPLAQNAKVSVDPDKIFGRHLAVLGNTGSGKSCSVAGVIRWSLENAQEKSKRDKLNARFIILDPNGEYNNAFPDFEKRVFQVKPENEESSLLKVPAWMWNSEEWSVFSNATSQAQKPLLIKSLKEMRTGVDLEESIEKRLYRVIKGRSTQLRVKINSGPEAYSGQYRSKMECGKLLEELQKEIAYYVDQQVEYDLETLHEKVEHIRSSKSWKSKTGTTGYNGFNEPELREILKELESVLDNLPISQEEVITDKGADTPISFEIENLPSHLELTAESSGNIQYVQPLIERIRTMLSDIRMKPIISNEKSESLLGWLNNYIGKDNGENGNITIIDLSLVPSEITHIITSVISRVVFESMQRYRKLNDGKTLPTVLAMEEAHNFIKKNNDENSPSYACTQTFERIAREGRKFGLGLIVSSQRPSELSPTVLSQCNTFLLHRLVNDRDQDLVRRLVPDNVEGLLNDLPSLPSRQAILVGWASLIPIIVNLNELKENQRPRSDDPEFYDVWVGNTERKIDWESIVDDWN
ncbi:DUF87 domain-containing protein [Salicibibacter kimchii]|uniref:DUF87 domain-containing protein n=2 Tax=Salicibibacter kimchii TaxID=2099786 RepID=A0A345BWH0_9BACI|nr:DUF87 domain-containing protein [Salicibibacter kimchii]